MKVVDTWERRIDAKVSVLRCDDMASPPPAYATDPALALSLAAAEHITLNPTYAPGGQTVWRAAHCNAGSYSGETTWVGMTNGRGWWTSANPCVAVCLAVLAKYGISVPEGRPERGAE